MRQNLRDLAYELLKQRILDSTYSANDVIDEHAIAEELHASRTPIREAIISLSQEGYLQIVPQRGIFVKPFVYSEVLEIFQIREVIEPWCVKEYAGILTKEEIRAEREKCIAEHKAFKDGTERFYPKIAINHTPHTLFFSKCNNRLMRELIDKSESLGKRKPFSGLPDLPQSEEILSKLHTLEEGHEAHMRMLDLAERGQIDELVEATREHIMQSKEDYLKYWFHIGI